MTLDPIATFTNHGIAKALPGSTLTLTSGAFINTDGAFRAEGAGALLNLAQNAEIQGGLLTSAEGGEVRLSAGTVLVNGIANPVTISGAARIPMPPLMD